MEAEAAAVAVGGAEREPVAGLEVGSARAAAGQRLSLVQLLALRRRPAHGAAAPPAAPAPQRPGGGGGGGGGGGERGGGEGAEPQRGPPARPAPRGAQRRGQGPAARPAGSSPPRPGTAGGRPCSPSFSTRRPSGAGTGLHGTGRAAAARGQSRSGSKVADRGVRRPGWPEVGSPLGPLGAPALPPRGVRARAPAVNFDQLSDITDFSKASCSGRSTRA